ncbi:hypothetical protein CsSME_00038259 [Camellia sinensis var. sinensis]
MTKPKRFWPLRYFPGVEVQYRGDGEAVELAGSFNGWHHRITMDPQPSSSILDAIGSRRVDFDDMFFPGNLDFGQQCCGFIRGHMRCGNLPPTTLCYSNV